MQTDATAIVDNFDKIRHIGSAEFQRKILSEFIEIFRNFPKKIFHGNFGKLMRTTPFLHLTVRMQKQFFF